jgi:hypothetical protein
MHAVSKSRAVATYVFFASTLAPLSHAYMIAYGHGTLDGLTRSSSPARYRAPLDPTCCDAHSRVGPSASVLSRSPSRRILPGDSSPAILYAAHPPALVGPTRSAPRSSISRLRNSSSATRTSLRSPPSRSTPC